MGKMKKTIVGSLCESNDPLKPRYIKVRKGGEITLKEGDILRVESRKFQVASAEAAGAAGKLSADVVAQIKERVSKQPDFVLAEVVVLRNQD